MAPPLRKIHLITGGSTNPAFPHLSLASEAYGHAGRLMHDYFCTRFRVGLDIELEHHCSRMVRSDGAFRTNADLEVLCRKITNDPLTKIVIMNAAVCDFDLIVPGVPEGQRLDSSRDYDAILTPAKKLLPIFRQQPDAVGIVRKDIFLIGFKVTVGVSTQEMLMAGLKSLKQNSCNLVVVNDIQTRRSVIITPEEAAYPNNNGMLGTTSRDLLFKELADITWYRSQLSFTQSTVVAGTPVPWTDPRLPATLRSIVEYCVDQRAYKNLAGGTVGHFACKLTDTDFLTSIRKSDFNDIRNTGLVHVKTSGPDTVLAYGAKPSVGGQSQRQIFRDHPGYDAVLHFHCPLREDRADTILEISQREVECGSHQCGANTSSGLREFSLGNGQFVKAVHLQNHGPNIVFPRDTDFEHLRDFVARNWNLAEKTGGFVVEQPTT